MNVWAVMMVKDELDVLPFVLDHLIAEGLDGFYIADNMSTDGTREMLARYAETVPNFFVIDDLEPGYYQQQKMNTWIRQAVELGAEYILPIDADEIWYATDRNKTLVQAVNESAADVVVARVFDMVPQPSDENTGNPLMDITHREPETEIFPCVGFKFVPDCWVTQGNHDVSHSGTRDYQSVEICHYQYRSLDQYKRKLRNGKAAYDATDLPYDLGYHWREGGALSDQQLEQRWNEYITQPGLYYYPAPVKTREV